MKRYSKSVIVKMSVSEDVQREEMYRYISSVKLFKVSHPKFDRVQLLCSSAQYPKIIANIRDALFFAVSMLPPTEFLHWGNEVVSYLHILASMFKLLDFNVLSTTQGHLRTIKLRS